MSKTLEGVLGWENKALKRVANELFPATKGGPFVEYACGSLAVTVRGSVLVKFPAVAMVLADGLVYSAKPPTHFESEEASDVLESSFSGGPFEVSTLQMKLVQTNEEKIEVNWFV